MHSYVPALVRDKKAAALFYIIAFRKRNGGILLLFMGLGKPSNKGP